MPTTSTRRPGHTSATTAPAPVPAVGWTPAAGYAHWTTDQLAGCIDALGAWALERRANGAPVDPSTFELIQAMASERATR